MSNKIRHYRVEISDSTGLISPKNEFTVTEYDVIGENESNLVINDRNFTTISKTPSDYKTSLDQKSISLYTADSCWGNRVFYSFYSFGDKKPSAIKKEIERAIMKKFGFFISGINLNVIK